MGGAMSQVTESKAVNKIHDGMEKTKKRGW